MIADFLIVGNSSLVPSRGEAHFLHSTVAECVARRFLPNEFLKSQRVSKEGLKFLKRARNYSRARFERVKNTRAKSRQLAFGSWHSATRFAFGLGRIIFASASAPSASAGRGVARSPERLPPFGDGRRRWQMRAPGSAVTVSPWADRAAI